ncbi:alpha/beta hydrolase-fold protein [Steroidobacter sp.]|uniref:alpha/beta hydrolase-fold protein n=1 Tax=Steroidobacter sp. TaxID=1978227 RepID=UPI001A563B72|nr:alpha/beta hydrolase-fold protein [Steroidobacter sp.]MBL8271168.1 DUF3327 domain-containing protein [Steroidobacter sp.]
MISTTLGRCRPFAAFLACCLLFVSGRAAAADEIASPRIAELRAQLASQSEAARTSTLEAFWQQAKKSGTPLIEPVAGDEKSMLVTFLWRDAVKDGMSNVAVKNQFKDGAPVDRLARLEHSDVWYRTYKQNAAGRFTYSLVFPAGSTPHPNARRLSLDGVVTEFIADPLARANYGEHASFAEGPKAMPEPWRDERSGVPRGRVEEFRATSTELGNTRDIAVYLPPGYKAGGAYPFVVSSDKESDAEEKLPQLMDNMIADGAIPPMVVIMVSYIDGAHRNAELPHNPKYTRFIAKELVPLVRSKYGLTRDPKQAVIRGCSLGGIGSTSVGMAYPEVFGNVLSQSGSYWWTPTVDRGDRERFYKELGWLPSQFATGKKLPLKFYLELGSEEGAGLMQANRQFRDILLARDYDVTYQEHIGMHCSVGARSTFPTGLITLVGTRKGRAMLAEVLK